jgi:hypothetical protein
MSEQDEKPNTIYLTSAYVRRADAIARAMTPPNGIQPKRSAVVQKAIGHETSNCAGLHS